MSSGFIKSPFNYIGGKYRLLGEIMPQFPTNINRFVDVFGGGYNVGINTTAKEYVYNDHLTPLVELLEYFTYHSTPSILNYIHYTIKENNLSKTDKETFNIFREKYNQSDEKCPLDLYILLCFSFNHQLRFNNRGEYNSSHGTNRSAYNKKLEHNLIMFLARLHDQNIIFHNKDFLELDYSVLSSDDFVYFDPPYLKSTANYNDGNRGFKNWTHREEKQLYHLLNKLDKKGVQWGLSNMTVSKTEENPYLIRFIENHNFTIHEIHSNYYNSNYQKKKHNSNDREVYITNIME